MIKRSKFVYVIGSVIIGIMAIVSVFAGLVFSGAIDARSVALVFTSTSQEKVYDGTALTSAEWSLVSGELKDGHTATVTVTGSQTGVGTTENSLSARIFDANGADVTGDYDITCNPGALTVTARPLTISSLTLEREYNGAPVAVGEPEIKAGELVAGDVAEFQMIGEIIDVGVAENLFSTTIVNELGVDVTANYQITSFAGAVTVKGKPIELTSGGDIREYDGTPLTKEEVNVTSGELLEGDSVEATYSGTVTDKGSARNSFQPKIVNADGEDVTRNYTITAIYGDLIVTSRTIGVETLGWTKIYDGKPLVVNGEDAAWIREGDSLVGEDTVEFEITGDPSTDAGWYENKCTATFYDAEGNVSENYTAVYNEGILWIKERVVTVKLTEGISFTYNGEKHEIDSDDCSTRNLSGEDYVSKYTLSKIGPDAGVYVVQVEAIEVKNNAGEDVSSNYKPNPYAEGSATITKRVVELDVIELEQQSSYYKFVQEGDSRGDGLLETHEIKSIACTLSEEERKAARDNNEEIEWLVAVNDKNKNTPQELNYRFELVEPQGDPLDSNEINFTQEVIEFDWSNVHAEGDDSKEFAYLRFFSYGDYSVDGTVAGNVWKSAQEYTGDKLYDAFGMQYLTGLVLKENGYSVESLSINLNPNAKTKEDIQNRFLLAPYYLADYVPSNYPLAAQASDVKTSGYYNRYVKFKYYSFDYTDLEKIDTFYYTQNNVALSPYRQAAEDYAGYVNGVYLQLPDATASFLDEKLNRDSRLQALFLEDDLNEKISLAVKYIKDAAIYIEKANELLANSTDFVCDFFNEGVGNCQHFASAATALFRYLDIPARYTLGYRVEKSVLANKYKNSISGLSEEFEKHAWVEVFVEGIGWIQVDATPERPTIELKAPSRAASMSELDALGGVITLTAEDVKSAQLSNLLDKGIIDDWALELSGATRSSVGSNNVSILEDSVRFYLNGNDITDEIKEIYKISCVNGKLSVYQSELYVETASRTDFIYNGKMQTHYELKSTDYSQLREGDTVSIRWTGSRKDVGTSKNSCVLTVYNANGENVTGDYKINYTYGTLKVSKLVIIVAAGSAEKFYDGTALVCNEYTVSGQNGVTLPNHTFEARCTGSQTEVGSSDNIVSYLVVKDDDNKIVTDNYEITLVTGRLKVLKN